MLSNISITRSLNMMINIWTFISKRFHFVPNILDCWYGSCVFVLHGEVWGDKTRAKAVEKKHDGLVDEMM